MDEDRVLYVYKCSECGHRGSTHLPGDEHDGAMYQCSSCGTQVYLEWDGGVTFEFGPGPSPADEARRWREEKGYVGRAGVVVIFNGIADAWVDKLRNPEHWQPGCIAVDESGKTWTAIGGTEQGGALMWLANEPISD